MIYPPPIDSAAVAEHFKRSLAAAKRDEWPYRHWKLKEIYPEALCTGILALPVAAFCENVAFGLGAWWFGKADLRPT